MRMELEATKSLDVPLLLPGVEAVTIRIPLLTWIARGAHLRQFFRLLALGRCDCEVRLGGEDGDLLLLLAEKHLTLRLFEDVGRGGLRRRRAIGLVLARVAIARVMGRGRGLDSQSVDRGGGSDLGRGDRRRRLDRIIPSAAR